MSSITKDVAITINLLDEVMLPECGHIWVEQFDLPSESIFFFVMSVIEPVSGDSA